MHKNVYSKKGQTGANKHIYPILKIENTLDLVLIFLFNDEQKSWKIITQIKNQREVMIIGVRTILTELVFSIAKLC